MCDTHRETLTHIMPEVLPAALAIAELNGNNGTELLTAVTIGCEIACRIGLGIDYPAFRERGWHGPGVIGPFGAAAAVGHLLKFNKEKMTHAFGLAGSQAAGTFAAWGTPTVKFHQCRGSLSGLMAAILAEQDFNSSKEILTAKDGGLYNSYSNGGKPERAVKKLGVHWEFQRIALRMWPAASGLQGMITALVNFVSKNKFSFDNSGKYPKQIPAYKWWRSHPERREYNRVDFLPLHETPDGVFNMWKGFAVQPKGGLENIPLFHELLDEVICSGNEKWALYLWSWLAHMIQFPKEKPGVAVVLRSDAQGVGKSCFADYVGSLLGRHFRTVTHGRHIHGNFNSHLKDTLMLFGDEAVWGGDRRTESILKQLITEPNMIIEMKGKDVFEVRSYLRLMLATNSEWAAPVGLTDRRYFVLNVSNSRKNDHNFFKRLIYEQNHGGIEALLQVLMDFDLSDFEVRNIPETPARLDQKFLSMEPIEKWWLEILSNEDFLIGGKILDFDDMNRVAKADLLYSFNEHTKAYKPNHRNWEAVSYTHLTLPTKA